LIAEEKTTPRLGFFDGGLQGSNPVSRSRKNEGLRPRPEPFCFRRPQGKHPIASILADRYQEELAPRLPPFRKPWMSEDERMAMFDAAALAVAYFCRRE